MKALIRNFALSFFLLVAVVGIPLQLQAQSARDQYNSAKLALEESNYQGCLIYLERCENLLGGSNVRIEALRAQCYALMEEWVKAKIAYRNYEHMLDVAERGGVTWDQMQEIGREINAGLEQAERAFEKKIEDEKKENLRQVESDIREDESRKTAKANRLNEANGDKLYQLAMDTRDPNALALFKEEAAGVGGNSRTAKVEEELDKHKNPNKYLVAAVLNKNRPEVEYLLSLGGDKNLKNKEGNSLLHLTVDKGDQEMQRMLKEKGADLEIRNSRDETPLMYALQQNNSPMIRSLLNLGGDAKAANRQGITALHYAVVYTAEDWATRLLLDKGAAPNTPLVFNDTLMSPLYYAVHYRRSGALAKTLISAGANINEGKKGWTPLMAAVLSHDLPLLQLLLKNTPDVNAKGIHGWTALHFAARENQPHMVAALLAAGANKRLLDEWGRSPKRVAYENETKESLKALRK